MVEDYRNILLRELWHPSERELMLYANGELSLKAAAKVRIHIEACWSCRVRQENIESSITAFMQYRDAFLEDASTFPPSAEGKFKAKLNRQASEFGRQSLTTF